MGDLTGIAPIFYIQHNIRFILSSTRIEVLWRVRHVFP